MSKIITLCRSYMWWPGLYRNIEEFIWYCEACLQNKSELVRAEPAKWKEGVCPMDWIHVNFLYLQGNNFLIIMYAYIKRPDVIQIKTL